ncbi:hypothetical protein DFH09DRAFT_1180556, partial [Mycena vulgaris]
MSTPRSSATTEASAVGHQAEASVANTPIQSLDTEDVGSVPVYNHAPFLALDGNFQSKRRDVGLAKGEASTTSTTLFLLLLVTPCPPPFGWSIVLRAPTTSIAKDRPPIPPALWAIRCRSRSYSKLLLQLPELSMGSSRGMTKCQSLRRLRNHLTKRV